MLRFFCVLLFLQHSHCLGGFRLAAMEHATVPIPTDLEPDQEAMLKELREGEPRVELSVRVEIQRVHVLGV